MRRPAFLLSALLLIATACGDDGDVGGGVDAELAQLVVAAEDVRGLEFVEPPQIVVVSSGNLADRVRDQIEEDLDVDEAEMTENLFELLGLLDGSVDLIEAYRDLYAEQVAGYYDDDTGELVVSGDAELSPLTKTIVLHELIHALTDQHFGFAGLLDDLIDEERFEEAAAIQALAEGDATYFQLVYMQTLPTSEQVEAIQESLSVDTSVADSLPDWFSADLTFPYDAGFAFVDQIITDTGVTGLNQTYTLLPTTTEHIIHPGSYFTRQPPRTISLPAFEVDGYEVVEEGQWGEWNLQLFLLDGVDPGEATVAATGWGGDHYRIYQSGDSIAFAYVYLGDSQRDADELARSLADSVRGTMAVGSGPTTAGGTTFTPGEDFAAIVRDGERVLFVAADDPVVGAALMGEFRSIITAG